MNGRLHADVTDEDVEQGTENNSMTQDCGSKRVGFSQACDEYPAKSVRFSLYSETNEVPKIRQHYNQNSVKMILSDWIFLAVLGVLTAFLSISVDMMIYCFQEVQAMTFPVFGKYGSLDWWTWTLSFAAWCTYTIGLICASATFVHYVSPQAIGSGIPEMKTIIRGVKLKDYLTFRTLISKVFGVALSLGSGVPIGKMGPFVHIGSAVAYQLSLLASRFDSAFRSEARRSECLAAACAVGVACTFSAPVGGVLFSIEVTTMYFSVRSYWRGFFAACCGAITIRLLRGFVAQTEVTVNAFFQTSFAPDAFIVKEIPLFVLLGIVCGVLGALYIALYRTVVLFLRNNKYAKKVFQQHWIVYPVFVSFVFSVISFPHGLGMFSTGRLKFGMNLKDFFSNCTFSAAPPSFLSCSANLDIFSHWLDNRENILVILILFVFVHFVFSVICMTLPVPSGCFMPIFVLGAGIGRLVGEMISVILPTFVASELVIYPGVYAVVGGTMIGLVNNRVKSELKITGQLHYILPVMVCFLIDTMQPWDFLYRTIECTIQPKEIYISVLLSNAVCAYVQPSFFDTIIKIKHLPFLPDIPPSNNIVHTIRAENIMISPVMFVTRIITYEEIQKTLIDGCSFQIFPVVDSSESQMLVGTVSRSCLEQLLEAQVGEEARREEAGRRVRKAIETIDMHFQTSLKEIFDNTRTKSESSLSKMIYPQVPPILQEQAKKQQKAVSGKSRFTVSPGHVIDPPYRRNSLTRRNAFCSLETNDDKTKEEDDEDAKSEDSGGLKHHLTLQGIPNYHTLVRSYMRQAKKYLHYMQFGPLKQEKSSFNLYDLSQEEQKQWEEARLNEEVDLTEDIDPAPFQIVKKTSLFNIHSIFSMLQLSRVYVTEGGRLVGVVSLSDVRRELERSQEKIPRKESIVRHGITAHMTGVVPLMHTPSEVVDILTPTLEGYQSCGSFLDYFESTAPFFQSRRQNKATSAVFSVVKSTNLSHTSDEDADVRSVSPLSHHENQLRRRSTHCADKCVGERTAWSEKQRVSFDERHHEGLVEAVAYLRRKSFALPATTVKT